MTPRLIIAIPTPDRAGLAGWAMGSALVPSPESAKCVLLASAARLSRKRWPVANRNYQKAN